MLPSMRSRNPTPIHVSQQQASGSVDNGRQPDLVTIQIPPRGPTAQTSITESHVSEAPTLDIPTPMPPPAPGSGRESIRRGTHESYNPASGPSYPQQESDSAHYEAQGISEGIHARVWPTYNKISQDFDEKRLKQLNDNLDVLLIFAALFSAIVTAFLVRALDDLDPDYQQQSALLLHQILNGRDPKLADISDPTIPQRPTNSAIVVNCLWFASLLASLGASLCAIICKGWLTEYTSGTNPAVGLLRACRRHTRFMAFQQLNIHTLVDFLPSLLHSSVLLFLAGAMVYLLRMDKRVAICFTIMGGIIGVAYFTLIILPFTTDPPFRHHSKLPTYRLFVAYGNFFMTILGSYMHRCYRITHWVSSMMVFQDTQAVRMTADLRYQCARVWSLLQELYNRVRSLWENTLARLFLEDIDTSQKVQEGAIMWLSQVPLDPSESKALVSSLALISSSRPCKFEKPVIVLLNSVLEASLREGSGREGTDVAIDCVIVLGNIKFQSVVDRNLDRDHNIGGIPIPPSVAQAAQRLLADAPKENIGIPYSGGIQERLLTATAWLSPMAEAEASECGGGENSRIQDRRKFVEEIRVALERHVRGENLLNTGVLTTLIRGMHACILRGNNGNTSSTVSFLPSFCEDYDSPWSGDRNVLKTLITYALDLLLRAGRRRPLVERDIGFNDLASELLGTLTITNTTRFDVAFFAFWLVCRVPSAFTRRMDSMDIDRIWVLAKEVTPEDYRERLNSHAICALAIAIQHQVSTYSGLSRYPCYTNLTDLMLPNVAFASDSSRPMAIYVISMILNLSSPTDIPTLTGEVNVGSIIDTLFPVGGGDVERNVVEAYVVDLYIYSTLILLRSSPAPELEVEKLKGLIAWVGNAIEVPFMQEFEAAGRSEAGIHTGLDRARWKAIYLSGLLFKLLPGDQREGRSERLRAQVQGLLESGELSPAVDYHHCLQPLAVEVSIPRADRREREYTVFEAWIRGFPLLPLTEMQVRNPMVPGFLTACGGLGSGPFM